MKFILISDLHLLLSSPPSRVDDLELEQWKKLDIVYSYASKAGASIIQAGDFVDSPRSWILLKKLFVFFKRFPDVKTYFVMGQHDLYMRSKESFTIINVIEKLFKGRIILLTKKPVELGNIRLFGLSYVDDLSPIPTSSKYFNILVIHRPITIAKDLLQHYGDARKVVKKIGKFDCTICGDIHRKFFHRNSTTNRVILNSGPLLRKSYIEVGYPGFFVLDTEFKTYIFKKVSNIKNPFKNVSNNSVDFAYLKSFVKEIQKEGKETTYLKLSSKEKVFLAVKFAKNKKLKPLISSIINSD